MSRLRFPLAVAITSLALVALLAVGGFLMVRTTLAGAPWAGGDATNPPWLMAAGLEEAQLPPALQQVTQIPPAERFSHFLGARLQLTDRNQRPITVTATPGSVSAVDATSLTLQGNDGVSHRYTLDSATLIRGKLSRGGGQVNQPTLVVGDRAVVITINDSSTATGILVVNANGLGRWSPAGPFGRGR